MHDNTSTPSIKRYRKGDRPASTLIYIWKGLLADHWWGLNRDQNWIRIGSNHTIYHQNPKLGGSWKQRTNLLYRKLLRSPTWGSRLANCIWCKLIWSLKQMPHFPRSISHEGRPIGRVQLIHWFLLKTAARILRMILRMSLIRLGLKSLIHLAPAILGTMAIYALLNQVRSRFSS